MSCWARVKKIDADWHVGARIKILFIGEKPIFLENPLQSALSYFVAPQTLACMGQTL